MWCFLFVMFAGLLITGWWERRGQEILERREIGRLARASAKAAWRATRRSPWRTVGRRNESCSP